MAENLTYKKLTTWKNSIDKAISTNLAGSLKKIYSDAHNLHTITASGEEEKNLSYRFNDLAKVTNEATKQITNFMVKFDSSLTEYMNVVKKAEETAAENMRQQIDQFAEAADKISKLSMS